MAEELSQEALVEKGRSLLSGMAFSSALGTNYGYPKFTSVPSSTRKESDAEYQAIEAFLQEAQFVQKTDYEWSFWDSGDQAVLNFKTDACKRLQALIRPELRSGGTEIESYGR